MVEDAGVPGVGQVVVVVICGRGSSTREPACARACAPRALAVNAALPLYLRPTIAIQGAVRVFGKEALRLGLGAVGGARDGEGRRQPLGAHRGPRRVHVQLDVVAVVLLEQGALGVVPVAPQRRLVLVVAGPHHHAGVATKAAVLLADLLVHGAEERLAHGVHSAGEHQVLPHHDAELVGELRESKLN